VVATTVSPGGGTTCGQAKSLWRKGKVVEVLTVYLKNQKIHKGLSLSLSKKEKGKRKRYIHRYILSSIYIYI
jgi:hypothetical protein